MHLFDGAVPVDDDDAVGGDLGYLLVGLGDGALEVEALGLEAVVAVGALDAELGVDAEQDVRSGQRPSVAASVSEIVSPTPRPRAAPW